MFRTKVLSIGSARNFTPFRESGMRAGMIAALKIIVARTAVTGLWSCMTSRRRAAGLPGMTAGKSVKYFAMSFVTLNVVMAPRVIRSCLPTSTTFRIFAGSESRSTMLAASRAAEVPLFIAIPTSAFARAGASFVPSPSTPTTCPRFCSSSTRTSLSAGFAPAMTSSMPASWAITRAVSSASPVTMTVLMPVARTASSFSRMCGFRLSRRLMSPTTKRSTATAIGVPPVLEISWACQRSSASLTSGDRSRIASTAPLRTFAGRADTSRSRRPRQEPRRERQDPSVLLRDLDDRAAFRRLVVDGGEVGRLAHLLLRVSFQRDEFLDGPLALRDRPGLVEDQDVDVPRRLDRLPRLGHDVRLADAGDPRDPDRGQEPSDRRRHQGDEEGDQDREVDEQPEVVREEQERAAYDEEDRGEPDQEDRQADLARGLRPLRILDEGDHLIEVALPGLRDDRDEDRIRRDLRAADDVAATLLVRRDRFAGHHRLIDVGLPFLDHPVPRDELARVHAHDVPGIEVPRRDDDLRVADDLPGRHVLLEGAQGIDPRAPLRLRHRLGERGEPNGQEQDPRDDEVEPARLVHESREGPRREAHREDEGEPGLDHEHDGTVLPEVQGVEFDERVEEGAAIVRPRSVLSVGPEEIHRQHLPDERADDEERKEREGRGQEGQAEERHREGEGL